MVWKKRFHVCFFTVRFFVSLFFRFAFKTIGTPLPSTYWPTDRRPERNRLHSKPEHQPPMPTVKRLWSCLRLSVSNNMGGRAFEFFFEGFFSTEKIWIFSLRKNFSDKSLKRTPTTNAVRMTTDKARQHLSVGTTHRLVCRYMMQ